jgi:hypothetical protein
MEWYQQKLPQLDKCRQKLAKDKNKEQQLPEKVSESSPKTAEVVRKRQK